MDDIRARLRSTAVRAIDSLGVTAAAYLVRFGLERQLGKFFRDHRITHVLDVGACVGQYARQLRTMGYSGSIISFEPTAASFASMSARMSSDPLWTGQPYGLSDEDRTATIHTYTTPELNSILELSHGAHAAYSVPEGQAETVQLRRLDGVLDSLVPPDARVFLKMDTQGHDILAFRGAKQVLNRIVGIQSELSAIQLYEHMPSMADSLSVYRSHGFFPIGFHVVNEVDGMVPEFDVILTRPNNHHVLIH